MKRCALTPVFTGNRNNIEIFLYNWRTLYFRIYWTYFYIFSPYESTSRAHDRFGPLFPICQGTLPWQPIKFGRN